MLGSGTEMMDRFIKTNNLVNDKSPDIFLNVHALLDKKLKRIKAIEELYEKDGDAAPMTKCPCCGSPTLIVRNCEFCGYDIIVSSLESTEAEKPEAKDVEKEAKEEVKVEKQEVKKEVKDVEFEVEKKEVKETVKTKSNIKDKEPKKVTIEDVNKSRKAGIRKIVADNNLELELDIEKDDMKKVKKEVLSKLGLVKEEVKEEVKEVKEEVEEVKEKSKRKKKNKKPDYSKLPTSEQLEDMDEDELTEVIIEFGLEEELLSVVSTLRLTGLSDEIFFSCVDETNELFEKLRPSKVSKFKEEDIPSMKELEDMDEKQLLEVYKKFDLKVDIPNLTGEEIRDEDEFFEVVDLICAELKKISDSIKEEAEKALDRKVSSIVRPVESFNFKKDEDENEDIDLDSEELSYSIDIEDIVE